MRKLELAAIFPDEDSAINWALELGLLNNEPLCYKCGGETKWSAMRKVWYCKKRECNRLMSLTSRTLFDHLSSIKDFLLLIYEWTVQTSAKQVSLEYNLRSNSLRR